MTKPAVASAAARSVYRKSLGVSLIAAVLFLLLANHAGWPRSTLRQLAHTQTTSRRHPAIPACPTPQQCRTECLDNYQRIQSTTTKDDYLEDLRAARVRHDGARTASSRDEQSSIVHKILSRTRQGQAAWSLSPFAISLLHARLQIPDEGSTDVPSPGRSAGLFYKRAAPGAKTETSDTTRTSLDGHGIFAIIVFAAVSLIVIRPIKVRVPQRVATVVRSAPEKAWKKLVGAESEHGAGSASDPTAGVASASPQRMYLTIDHVTAPLIGVLLLLATTTIGGSQIRAGIVGEDGIEPYDVLLLFISLAYISISLDATGLLRYLAFLICLKSGGRRGQEGSGKKLYLFLYFFFWSAGVLVGNDPVILSGTAFLVYLTRVAGISPPDAWIWGEFVAANISSAVLVSSNPTNLVIATGFGVEFITYTAYMVLPAFASAVTALLCILLFFRNRNIKVARSKEGAGRMDAGQADDEGTTMADGNMRHRGPGRTQSHGEEDAPSSSRAANDQNDTDDKHETKRSPLIHIPHRIIQPDVDARAALVDLSGAIFGSFVMATTLATLVGTSVVGGVKVFEIAVPGAVLCFIRDGAADYLRTRKEKKRLEKEWHEKKLQSEDREEAAARSDALSATTQGEERIEMSTLGVSKVSTPVMDELTSAATVAETSPTPSPSIAPLVPTSTPRSRRPLRTLLLLPSKVARTFPTVTIVLSRLPLPLLPFAFGMFIMVQALSHVGFINILAGGLGKVCASGYFPTAFFVSMLGAVLCNIGGTNIGATILLTKSILSPFFQDKISHLPIEDQARILKMATYSIAFSSNVDALGGTFAASLAGLLWLSGLRQGGITVKARQFAIWCAVVIVPATAAGVAVLIAEVRYFKL